MKNRYHPLLKQKYFLGMLSANEISLVNQRTLYSWAHISQHELVGYNPNDPLINEKEVFAFVHNYEHARKMLGIYMALFSLFQSLLKHFRGFEKKLRENKEAVIITYRKCREFIKPAEFETICGISFKKISRWESEINCEKSFLNLCKAKNTAQLSFNEQAILTQALQDPQHDHLFVCDIWAKLLRAGELHCKLRTFYKYARIAIKKFGLRKRKAKRAVHSIIAKAPLAVLHVDCTVVHTDDRGKWHLNIIYDNFCKAILGIRAMLNPNSHEVALNLRSVIDEYGLHDKKILLYCDGGPENKKHVDDLLLNYPKIKKLVTSFSNGIHNNMIESYNSKFKRKHIRLLDLSRHEKVPEQLEHFKNVFNNTPQTLTGTLSPNEVLSGLRPWKSIWPKLKNEIENAKTHRIALNKLSCCSVLKTIS